MSAPPAPASVPTAVIRAYGFDDDLAEPISGGLINQTFRVSRDGLPHAVVQRLHPIFDGPVNIDLDAITTHLADLGMVTPRLVRTLAGDRWVEDRGRVWRALTYVPGTTVHKIDSPDRARAAGHLVGRFHAALAPLDYEYQFTRAGVHDTPAHFARLRAAIEGPEPEDQPDGQPDGQPNDRADRDLLHSARELGRTILATGEQLPDLTGLPRRHTHGDLKISNLLFAPERGIEARCLVDLDTLGRQTMAYELGDALRSWCNTGGEDQNRARIDLKILAAAMDGYRSTENGLLTRAEWHSIVPGLQTICLELSARFCVDVYRDEYFGWDATRFTSRRAHNLVRARGQLALARSVSSQMRTLEAAFLDDPPN